MTAADTKGLEIPDCVIPLCINGKEFRLYATSGLSDTLVALAEEAVRLSVLTKDGDIVTYIAAEFADYGKMRLDRMARIGGDAE